MKYDVQVRVTAIGVIRVEAEDGQNASIMANDIFDSVKEADDYNLEVLHVEPVGEESPNDDLASQHAARMDCGPTKDDYLESGIDMQDPQWDQGNSYHGA